MPENFMRATFNSLGGEPIEFAVDLLRRQDTGLTGPPLETKFRTAARESNPATTYSLRLSGVSEKTAFYEVVTGVVG